MAQSFPRKTLTQFGSAGGSTNFGQFGSQAASAPVETKDITTIQALSAWVNGWQSAVALGEAPYLQDMNGWMLVHSYESCYLLTEGIPEWDAGTNYDTGSIVKVPYGGSAGTNYVYLSLADANLNNALPSGAASNASWQFLYGITGGGLIIPGVTNALVKPAGTLGEYVSGNGSNSIPTSNQWGDILSINLSAGNWSVQAVVASYVSNGATFSANSFFGFSTHTGNVSTGLTLGLTESGIANPPNTSTLITAGSITGQLLLSSPATVYFKFLCQGYSVATPVVNVGLQAWRI